MMTMLDKLKTTIPASKMRDAFSARPKNQTEDAVTEAAQVLSDKVETTIRVVPALMLSNILMASVVFVALAAFGTVELVKP